MLLSTLLPIALQMSAAASTTADVWSEVDPDRVCSTTISWRIGIQADSPREMEETVSKVVVGGRSVWRTSHALPARIGAATSGLRRERDVYDLDTATLHPIESQHRTADSAEPRSLTHFVYEIESDRARRLDDRGETTESIDLAGQVPLPEGPGSAAIYQAIAWRDGLRAHAYVVDRWRGAGDERLHRAKIEVIGRGAVTVQGQSMATFMVSVEPDNGAYRILHHVTAERPHQIVRTEYSAGSRPAFISEVAALTRDPACPTGA